MRVVGVAAHDDALTVLGVADGAVADQGVGVYLIAVEIQCFAGGNIEAVERTHVKVVVEIDRLTACGVNKVLQVVFGKGRAHNGIAGHGKGQGVVSHRLYLAVQGSQSQFEKLVGHKSNGRRIAVAVDAGAAHAAVFDGGGGADGKGGAYRDGADGVDGGRRAENVGLVLGIERQPPRINGRVHARRGACRRKIGQQIGQGVGAGNA